MKIAVLAVQGAFIEHIYKLRQFGVECKELRKLSDWKEEFDGLVLPGGESTVQGKLIRELGLYEPIQSAIQNGLPVLATCAGMILLAKHLEGDSTVHLGTLPVTVRRNAYGRQLGSFHTTGSFGEAENLPMTFIRAPYIVATEPQVEILSRVNGEIVAVRYKNQLALSYHPELNEDQRIYEYFLQEMVIGNTHRKQSVFS